MTTTPDHINICNTLIPYTHTHTHMETHADVFQNVKQTLFITLLPHKFAYNTYTHIHTHIQKLFQQKQKEKQRRICTKQPSNCCYSSSIVPITEKQHTQHEVMKATMLTCTMAFMRMRDIIEKENNINNNYKNKQKEISITSQTFAMSA